MAVGWDPTRPRESGHAIRREHGQREGSTGQNDRAGGARSDERSAGKGGAPAAFGREDDHDEDGCGNAVPMETRERFPQGLGNLATNAGFPHSHKPIIIRGEERQKNPEPETKVSPMYPV
jgi:hypothetical protein